jgi:cell division protein FtsL
MATAGLATPAREGSAAPHLSFALEDTSFVTVEGGGLDARVREGVSATLTRTVGVVIAAALTLFSVGTMSVATTSATVAVLESNSKTSSDIKALEMENDDLRIACSILSSSDRVHRIATQNLGMTYAADATHFQLS